MPLLNMKFKAVAKKTVISSSSGSFEGECFMNACDGMKCFKNKFFSIHSLGTELRRLKYIRKQFRVIYSSEIPCLELR